MEQLGDTPRCPAPLRRHLMSGLAVRASTSLRGEMALLSHAVAVTQSQHSSARWIVSFVNACLANVLFPLPLSPHLSSIT